jgi:hypothetical protein
MQKKDAKIKIQKKDAKNKNGPKTELIHQHLSIPPKLESFYAYISICKVPRVST